MQTLTRAIVIFVILCPLGAALADVPCAGGGSCVDGYQCCYGSNGQVWCCQLPLECDDTGYGCKWDDESKERKENKPVPANAKVPVQKQKKD